MTTGTIQPRAAMKKKAMKQAMKDTKRSLDGKRTTRKHTSAWHVSRRQCKRRLPPWKLRSLAGRYHNRMNLTTR